MNQLRDVVRVTRSDRLPQYRKPRTQRAVQRQIVESVKVDMRVWREAMRIARGDSTRIVVHSSTEVTVVNQSKKKR